MHTRRPQARPEVADPAALLRTQAEPGHPAPCTLHPAPCTLHPPCTQAEPGRLPPLSPESRGAARGAELSQDRLPSGPSAQRPGRRQRRLRGVPARAMDGWALGGGRPAQGHALSRACHHSKPWLGVGTGAAFQRRPGAGAAAGWRPWAVCGRRPARARPASECGAVVTLTAKRCDVGQDELSRTVSEAILFRGSAGHSPRRRVAQRPWTLDRRVWTHSLLWRLGFTRDSTSSVTFRKWKNLWGCGVPTSATRDKKISARFSSSVLHSTFMLTYSLTTAVF